MCLKHFIFPQLLLNVPGLNKKYTQFSEMKYPNTTKVYLSHKLPILNVFIILRNTMNFFPKSNNAYKNNETKLDTQDWNVFMYMEGFYLYLYIPATYEENHDFYDSALFF